MIGFVTLGTFGFGTTNIMDLKLNNDKEKMKRKE